MPRNQVPSPLDNLSQESIQNLFGTVLRNQEEQIQIIDVAAQEAAPALLEEGIPASVGPGAYLSSSGRWNSRTPQPSNRPRGETDRQRRDRSSMERARAEQEQIERQHRHEQQMMHYGRAINHSNDIWGSDDAPRGQLRRVQVHDEEDIGSYFSNPSIRTAGGMPKVPVSSYTIMKKLIQYVRNYDTAHNNDTYRLIIKVVTSVAIKKFGQQYTQESSISFARARVKKWISKNSGIEFVPDDINSWALVHPDAVHLLNSERGMLKVGYLTYSDTVGSCAHTGQEWVASDLIEVSDRGMVSPTAYDELGYWYCDNCTMHRPFHEEACGHCARRGSDVEIGRLYGYNDNVRDFIPTLFDVPAREFLVDGKIVKQRKGRKTVSTGQRKQPVPKLYFGLELEVVPRDGVSSKDALYWTSSVMKNYSLMKHDGSLANGGFEIVTAPATMEFHRKKLWADFFNLRLPNGKTAAGLVKSWNTTCCGLHIHFTRAACSEVQLSKMLVFYHSHLNSRFLGDIAGRTVGPKAAYCHQKEKKLMAVKDKRTNKVVRTTVDECNEHHDAITVSKRNGGKTVEVRIFRGNATMHGIMRALDFVAATLEWSAIAGINQKNEDLRYTKFLEWFDESSNRSRFPDLWKHLISLGYLGTRHKSKNKKVLDDLPSELKAA